MTPSCTAPLRDLVKCSEARKRVPNLRHIFSFEACLFGSNLFRTAAVACFTRILFIFIYLFFLFVPTENDYGKASTPNTHGVYRISFERAKKAEKEGITAADRALFASAVLEGRVRCVNVFYFYCLVLLNLHFQLHFHHSFFVSVLVVLYS
eukprot:gene3990-2845_t